jgi:hypothetical protein
MWLIGSALLAALALGVVIGWLGTVLVVMAGESSDDPRR